MSKEEIRLFIMEDQEIFLDTFCMYLEGVPHIKVSGYAFNRSECLEKTKRNPPDLFLLDLKIQGNPIEGFQAADEIIERAKKNNDTIPAIAFFSEHNYWDYINKAQKLGCSFIDKYRKPALVVKDLEAIHYEGKRVISVNNITEDPKSLKEQKEVATLLQSSLSPSEGQVVVNLPKYARNEDIASAINRLRSQKSKKTKTTIEAQLRDSYFKLDLNGKDNPRWILAKMVEKSGLMQFYNEINSAPADWFGQRRNKSPW
jgi:DNA-binding NarL/FixJ family response regulator